MWFFILFKTVWLCFATGINVHLQPGPSTIQQLLQYLNVFFLYSHSTLSLNEYDTECESVLKMFKGKLCSILTELDWFAIWEEDREDFMKFLIYYYYTTIIGKRCVLASKPKKSITLGLISKQCQ